MDARRVKTLKLDVTSAMGALGGGGGVRRRRRRPGTRPRRAGARRRGRRVFQGFVRLRPRMRRFSPAGSLRGVITGCHERPDDEEEAFEDAEGDVVDVFGEVGGR